MRDQYILGISALLPRQRRGPPAQRRDRRGRTGRTIHAQEGRPAFPTSGGGVLPAAGRHPRSPTSHMSGFYDKPLLKFERILETYLGVVPRGFQSFLMAGPLWIKDKLYIDKQLQDRARLQRADPLLRASRVARRQRVLSVAVRGRGDPHDGRRRRMGDGVDRHRPRQRARDPRRAAAGPIRSACSTRPSPTTPASR